MNVTELKNQIANVIKTNGNQEITGQNLQTELFRIIDALNDGKEDIGHVYPINSIFLSSSSTSPATSLGYGTWVSLGVVSMKDDSGDSVLDYYMFKRTA